MSRADINHRVHISFVVLISSVALKAKSNFLPISVKSILEWLATVIVLAARKILESLEVKTLQRESALSVPQLLRSERLIRSEPTRLL